MGLKTTTGKSTRQKIAELREKHQEVFDNVIQDSQALFFPKMAYLYKEGTHKVISFFPSEVGRGQDIYTEFVSRDYEPEDPERTLWKWPYNPHYATDYPTTDPHPVTGDVRYEIPVTELVRINPDGSAIQDKTKQEADTPISESDETIDFDILLPDPDKDLPLDQMTMRDYAAIHLGVPVSGKSWLNDIIKSKT